MPDMLESIGRRALLFLQILYKSDADKGKADKMKTVICPICGKVLQTDKPNKKYCSFACKEAGQKVLRLKWEARNAHYMKEYMKEYRRREKEENGN